MVAPAPTLLGAVRGALLEALCGLLPADGFSALLVDDVTRRILSHCCRLSELMDEAHVTLIENVHAPASVRSPLSLRAQLDVVYLISPSESSVDALTDDLSRHVPLYGGRQHVLFTRSLPRILKEQLSGCRGVERLVSLREQVGVEALVVQPHAFTLDAADHIGQFYGPLVHLEGDGDMTHGDLPHGDMTLSSVSGSSGSSSSSSRALGLQRLAEQLAALCGALGDSSPSIRYAKHCHPSAKDLARALADATNLGGSGGESGERPRRPVSIVLLERGMDLQTPLLLDFSYEALSEALGLLRKGRYRPLKASGGASSGGDEILLVGDEPLWAELRHKTMSGVEEVIQAHTKDFLERNRAVLEAQRRMARGEKLTTKELVETRRRLASVSYRREEERLRVHNELCEHLFGLLTPPQGGRPEGRAESSLFSMMELEQDLAVGAGADGRALQPRELEARLALHLRKPIRRSAAAMSDAEAAAAAAADVSARVRHGSTQGSSEGTTQEGTTTLLSERLRMLALLALSQPSSDPRLERLLEAIGLEAPERERLGNAFGVILRSLLYMGARAQGSQRRAGATSTPMRGLDSMPVLARHEPAISGILMEAFGKDLDEQKNGSNPKAAAKGDAFVWVRRSPFEPKPGGGGRPLGAWALADQPEAPELPLLLVFVLGGASHSELRCAREVAALYPTHELIFGSSAILTPSDFVEALQRVPPPRPMAQFEFRQQ